MATSDHGFFTHAPLLKSTACRRQNQRFKGCTEGGSSTTRKKGSHQCPICKGYGHRWYNCKNGDPDDIAAMLAEKGPPKKKKKLTQPCNESSNIVPIGSLPKTMYFPPSQSASVSLEDGTSLRSGSGSNQPEPLSIEYPMPSTQENAPAPPTNKPAKEKKGKRKARQQGTKRRKKFQCHVTVPQWVLEARPMRKIAQQHIPVANGSFFQT